MTYASRFVELNGVRLHYLEWPSDGPPLLIIHGNGHCGGVFAPLAERLAGEFHVFTLDLRGHGLSEGPGVYTWAAFRDDVTEFMDRRGLQNLLLVAHSRGGGLALLAAAQRLQRVRGVVAYEPTMPQTASLQSRLPELVQRTLKRRSRFDSRQEMYDHFRNRGAFKDWQDDFVRAYVQHGAIEMQDGRVELANPPEVEALMAQTMLDPTEWARIDACPVPVLAVYGERNARLREGNDPVDTLLRYFPNTTLRIQADSTHSGIMEHPDVFATSVREFAATLKGARH